MMKWLSPSEFDWNDAPLNKLSHAVTAVTVYLLAIVLIERRAKKYGVSESKMRFLLLWQASHNLFLCVISSVMVLSALFLTVRYKMGHHADDPETRTPFLTCTLTQRPSSGRLFYWVYMFYLSKYLELFDTVIQMLKGRRPPSFYFHVWHHTMYLLICWGYLEYRSSLAFMAVMINGSVHVVMYYYYHLAALGRKVWWKHLITQIQIVQFVAGYAFFSAFLKQAYYDNSPCNGKGVLALHALFNLTMLIGFIRILSRIRRAGASVPPTAAAALRSKQQHSLHTPSTATTVADAHLSETSLVHKNILKATKTPAQQQPESAGRHREQGPDQENVGAFQRSTGALASAPAADAATSGGTSTTGSGSRSGAGGGNAMDNGTGGMAPGPGPGGIATAIASAAAVAGELVRTPCDGQDSTGRP